MRLSLSLFGRELLAIEIANEPPVQEGVLPNGAPDIEVHRHDGEFGLGFGPPARSIAPRPAWSPTEED